MEAMLEVVVEEEVEEEEEEDKKVLKEDRIGQMRSAQHWLTTLSTTA